MSETDSTVDSRIATGRPNEDVLLEARNLDVRFEMDRGTSNVLNDVNMDIYDGEILAVVGESGSGKSMFASAMLDAVVDPGQLTGELRYHPDNGDPVNILDLDEKELKRLRWEEISMVFQGAMSSFNPVKTIRDHFEETFEAHDVGTDEGFERAEMLLRDVHLEPDRVLDAYPHELSGGMKQRTLIALSLVLDPNVLVMDEPTAALDLLMQQSILNLLRDIQEKYGVTMVFITHDLPLVSQLADRIAVMYAFEFAEIGPTDEIVNHAAHPYTRALLRSTPNLESDTADIHSIEGSSPDPVNIPAGCSYHPRCPLADETCKTVDPELGRTGDEHAAACHYTDRARNEIAISQKLPSDATEQASEPAVRGDEDPILEMDDVEVHFDQHQGLVDRLLSESETVRAVDGVSLDIYENDVVVLVGESGCGKTTLGKTAIGAQEPTGGSIRFKGQDIWQSAGSRGNLPPEIRHSLQIIHQDPGSSLNPNRTVSGILSEPLKIRHDLTYEERIEYIHSLLKRVGMTPPEDYADRFPFQLSGGEKQRVATIRALAMNPELILADEAVSALDVSLRVEMMDLMLELQDLFDTSFLMISHNLSNARYFAEKAGGRIGVMYLGELVEIGPAEQIIEDPKHPYTQALQWATPKLDPDAEAEASPLRKIDIPDPVNPPSGCRFHTRCPKAREACRQQVPTLETDGSSERGVACFRDDPDHEYWESPELTD